MNNFMFIFLNFGVSTKCQIVIRQAHTSLETFNDVQKKGGCGKGNI